MECSCGILQTARTKTATEYYKMDMLHLPSGKLSWWVRDWVETMGSKIEPRRCQSARAKINQIKNPSVMCCTCTGPGLVIIKNTK
jgi:hypothetical protein